MMHVFEARRVFGGPGADGLNVAPDLLGEGPVWDHRLGVLLWVDILRGGISCYAPSARAVYRWALPEGNRASFAVPVAAAPRGALGPLLCGSQHGLFVFDPQSGAIRAKLSNPCQRGCTFNDAKVDPHGNLFAGSIQRRVKPTDVREGGSGAVWFLSGARPYHPVRRVAAMDPVTLSNGLGWSPDGTELFFIDTDTKSVVAYACHPSKPVQFMKRRVVVAKFPAGRPDGMCVDSDGFLWVAALEGGKVLRIHPGRGEVVAEVSVPTPLVTSVCFGGPYLRQLYITTARGTTMEKAVACGDDAAGHLYVADVGVGGLPMTPFGAGRRSRL